MLHPSRGGFDQTVFARAVNKAGLPVPSATGGYRVEYKTRTREEPLPPTNTDGKTQGTWSVGGPIGWVPVVVTLKSGGCSAVGTTGFQGR